MARESTYRAARKKKGYSTQYAATMLGITMVTLNSYETGKTSPRADLLPDMAKLYGCSVNQLLGVK